jgi:hypothetical protein
MMVGTHGCIQTDLSARGAQHVALENMRARVRETCVARARETEGMNYHDAVIPHRKRAVEAIDENPQDATAPTCVKLRSGPIVIVQVEREAQLRADGPHAALEKDRINFREGNASNLT